MKTLNRLLLLAASFVLVVTAYAIYSGTTQITIDHDTFSHIQQPWLHQVREVCLFGVLIWCVLFLRGEPTFTRVGLLAVILAFAATVLPPKIFKEKITMPVWHESWH